MPGGVDVQGAGVVRGSRSRGFLSGGFCPGGVSLQEVSVWGGLSGNPPRTVIYGQYTSYWNAFLYYK